MTTTSPPRAAGAIRLALEAVEVRSSTSFSWMGDVAKLPDHVLRFADRRGIRRALVGAVQARLYDSFYTQGTPCPATVADASLPGRLRSMMTSCGRGARFPSTSTTMTCSRRRYRTLNRKSQPLGSKILCII